MPSKIKTLRPPWASLAAAGKPKRDRSARPSQGSRYTSKAHRTWRQAVLTAAAWQCRECGKVDQSNHADHIVPIEAGGEQYELSNGQCLCISCHGRKTRRENSETGKAEQLH